MPWPVEGINRRHGDWAATRAGVPGNTTRNGYHMVFWRTGNLEYCAVSYAGWDELNGLMQLETPLARS